MSLLIRAKDVSRLSIQENALIMVQRASPDDDDWWEVFYMYMKCITRNPQHPLPEPYLLVLEKIRSANSDTRNEKTILCRFYATATLGYLTKLRHDYGTAIRWYDQAESLYETISLPERQRHVRAMAEDFVSLLTSAETESVGSILDREIQTVRSQWAECQEHLRQCQQEAMQTQHEQQAYHDLAEHMSDDLDDGPPPNDLLHLWHFDATTKTPPAAKNASSQIILSSEIMDQVRKIPVHQKLAWLLHYVVEDGPHLYYGQVYRVHHYHHHHHSSSRKPQRNHKPKLRAVVHGDASTSRIQQLLHTYATACQTAPYRPSRIYVEAQDAQDPQLVSMLALMGCIHISEHRRLLCSKE